MKKLISAMLFCTPLSALAADATVNLTFKGTLTQPTCTASFVGTAGTDIAFGNINASDIVAKTDGSIIDAAPVKDVFVQLANCGGGTTAVLVSFGGPTISGYGFNGKAPSFTDPTNANALSGLGFALFANKSNTAPADAITFKSGDAATRLALTSLTKTGAIYKWPLFAKMVVTRDTQLKTSANVNTYSAGKDLIANAYVNISYE